MSNPFVFGGGGTGNTSFASGRDLEKEDEKTANSEVKYIGFWHGGYWMAVVVWWSIVVVIVENSAHITPAVGTYVVVVVVEDLDTNSDTDSMDRKFRGSGSEDRFKHQPIAELQ